MHIVLEQPNSKILFKYFCTLVHRVLRSTSWVYQFDWLFSGQNFHKSTDKVLTPISSENIFCIFFLSVSTAYLSMLQKYVHYFIIFLLLPVTVQSTPPTTFRYNLLLRFKWPTLSPFFFFFTTNERLCLCWCWVGCRCHKYLSISWQIYEHQKICQEFY